MDKKQQVAVIVRRYMEAEGLDQNGFLARLNNRLERWGMRYTESVASKWITAQLLPGYAKMIVLYLISDDSLKTLARELLAAMRPDIWETDTHPQG